MGNPYQRHHGLTKLAKHRYLVHNRDQIVWACREHHQRTGAQAANFNQMHICGAKDQYPCIIEVRHTFHGVGNLMVVQCINLGEYMRGLRRDTVRISKTIFPKAPV